MSKWDRVNRSRKRARARQVVPGAHLTRAERAWEQQLMVAQREGQILWYGREAIKLRLGRDSFYTADYTVLLHDMTLRLDEVKGARGWRLDDEGRTKWKAAGEAYPWILFLGAAKAESGWEIETYEPVQRWPVVEPAGHDDELSRALLAGGQAIAELEAVRLEYAEACRAWPTGEDGVLLDVDQLQGELALARLARRELAPLLEDLRRADGFDLSLRSRVEAALAAVPRG